MLFNHIIALADDLPGLDNGLVDWAKEQGGLFIVCIVVLVAGFYLVKQSIGKLIGTIVIGAIVFTVVGRPEHTFEQIGNIFEKFLGG